MFWIIVFGVIALFVWICCTGSNPSNASIAQNNYAEYPPYYMSEEQAFYIGKEWITPTVRRGGFLTPRSGYSEFPIVVKYLPDDTYLGLFDGYAMTTNEYEISIFREDHELLGDIPSGNKWLYELIEKEGGYVHCYGCMMCRGIDRVTGYPDGWYGNVCVETNKHETLIRNSEHNTRDKFYQFRKGELQDFLGCMQGQDEE